MKIARVRKTRGGSVHARKYGFPFQQPSTSCGTYTTIFGYQLATYLIIQLAKRTYKTIQKCNYVLQYRILRYSMSIIRKPDDTKNMLVL